MPLAPAKLSDKHHLIAYMKLGGASRDQIATQLDMEPTYVSAITESPMFKALMDQLRQEMRAKTIGTVVDRIISEGPASVEALVTLRDHADSETVKLGAARDLLDRNPETAKVSREDRRSEVRVVVDTRALQRIAGVLAEDAGITVDAEPGPHVPLPEPVALPMGIQTLDEAVAELQAAADAA